MVDMYLISACLYVCMYMSVCVSHPNNYIDGKAYCCHCNITRHYHTRQLLLLVALMVAR